MGNLRYEIRFNNKEYFYNELPSYIKMDEIYTIVCPYNYQMTNRYSDFVIKDYNDAEKCVDELNAYLVMKKLIKKG